MAKAHIVAALGLLLLGACSSIPDVDDLIDGSDATTAQPVVVGARGPLTPRQSKAVLRRLERESKDSDVLQRHLALESALAGSPLVVGNKVTLLRDGPAAFAAMFKAIRAARDHINLEYFTFEDVEDQGQHIGDLLVEKQNQGVQVSLVYDSIGSIGTPSALFDRLKRAGVNLVEFNPVNPIDAKAGYSLNDRDHRKILIVDGSVGIIGGVNLSTVYSSNPLSSMASGKSDVKSDPWRDNDLEIHGPAVAELQKLFLATWAKQAGKPLQERNFFPHIDAQGNEVVRIIGSSPDAPVPEYYVTLLSAIRNAERRIWITAAYFVPTHQEKEDLIHAARRGVDVRLLLPSHSDSELALRVGHSHYSDLLEAGAKIYETPNEILHSKMVVIDGVWSVIGSSNFDHRSVLFNDEVDAVVLGRDTAGQMEAMLRDDFAKARPIDLETWEDRPFSERVEDLFSRIWQVLL